MHKCLCPIYSEIYIFCVGLSSFSNFNDVPILIYLGNIYLSISQELHYPIFQIMYLEKVGILKYLPLLITVSIKL